MGLRRGERDVVRLGDLAIGIALRDELKDVELSLGQVAEGVGGRPVRRRLRLHLAQCRSNLLGAPLARVLSAHCKLVAHLGEFLHASCEPCVPVPVDGAVNPEARACGVQAPAAGSCPGQRRHVIRASSPRVADAGKQGLPRVREGRHVLKPAG